MTKVYPAPLIGEVKLHTDIHVLYVTAGARLRLVTLANDLKKYLNTTRGRGHKREADGEDGMWVYRNGDDKTSKGYHLERRAAATASQHSFEIMASNATDVKTLREYKSDLQRRNPKIIDRTDASQGDRSKASGDS